MKHKGLVVLVLVLLELGLCAGMYSIVQATASNLSALHVNFAARPTVMAEGLEEKRFPVDGPAMLTIENSLGTVRVAAGAGDEIAISAHKQVWAATPEDAQAALAAFDLQVTQVGNAVKMQPNSPPPSGLSFVVVRPSVDITVTVPVTTGINIHVVSGGITLSGTTGNVELNTNRGPIRVSNVQGSITLQSDSGDVTAEHVQGQVQITSDRGTLHLTDIRSEGDLAAKVSSGDIVLNDCAVNSIAVQTVRGKADLSACTTREVRVSTGTGDITLGQVRADTARLQAQRGNIAVDGASGSLWAVSDSGNITIKNGDQATLDVSTRRGTIAYAGSLGSGPHTLSSDAGDIRLSLPKETALTVELQTNRGKIDSQFAVTMTPQGTSNFIRGTINGGGATLAAAAHSGNIVLNQTSP